MIYFKDVEYSYTSVCTPHVQAVPPLTVEIEPGQLIRVQGARSQESGLSANRFGTNTLFKLMAGQLFPTAGTIRLPEHWRVVYVPVTPILFDGTLMYNLAFGSPDMCEGREAAVWK